MPDVKIILEAVDRASYDIKKVGDAIEGVDKETIKLERNLDALGGELLKVGAGFAGVAIAGFALLGSSTRLAARVETLGIVTETLGRNVGMTEEEVRFLEKAIQDKGITLQASRQAIAQMIQAEIDLASATDLARLAQDAAVISGDNSSDAFGKLVTVIATGNILMARNMGLMVDFQGSYNRFAESVGKSVDELSEQEKIQARVNEVMDKGTLIAGSYEAAMETAAKKMASLDRHVEESRRALGEMWLPTYAAAVDLVTDSLVWWQKLDQTQKDSVSKWIGIGTAAAGANASVFAGIGIFLKATAGLKAMNVALLAATAGSMGLAATMATIALPLTALVLGTAAIVTEYKRMQEELDNSQKSLGELNDELVSTTDNYDDYISGLQDAAKQEGLSVDSLGRLTQKQGEHRTATRQVIDATFALTEEQYAQQRAAERWTEIHGDYIRSMNETGEATSNFEEATRQAKLELINMESTALGSRGLRELQKAYDDGVISADEYRAGTRLIWETLIGADQAQIDMSLSVLEAEQAFRDGKLSAFEYLDVLRQLDRKFISEIEFHYTTIGTPGGEIISRQHGGPVTGGMPYLIGERGPELFVPHTSGHVVPNHNVYNNNLTIHTSAPHEPLIDDFNMMAGWI